ncbi:hypothetical protein B0A49_12412 [Cryomyces minteri]|uniref:RING-type E3 ubiquitin transferase n=1 Tax=Cryomyces minteri TaxID=331657 RepID=A0A4U0WBH7_9PEZI|nr:hypothetical protein B0A49_12412 [Cryomyces minteri]
MSSDGSSLGSTLNPALGGGEEVRVCNPCVPDPNYDPPPQRLQRPQQQPQQQHQPPHLLPFPSFEHAVNAAASSFTPPPLPLPRRSTFGHRTLPPAMPNFSQPRHRPTLSDASQFRSDPLGRSTQQDVSRNHRISFQNHSTTSVLPPPPAGGSSSFAAGVPRPRGHRFSSGGHGGTLPAMPSASRYRSMLDINAPLPPLPRHVQPSPSIRVPHPQPRRQIKEEDECPVCGNELPPKGPNGSDTDREAHVERCIRTHFSSSARRSPPPGPSTTTPTNTPPHPSTAISAAIAATAATPADAGALSTSLPAPSPSTSSSITPSHVPPQGQRPRASSHRQNRMLVYRATEKDCLAEDGTPAECVICFEEFEVGDEMGRLECLCKFHRGCIRKWWDTKGAGSCPTHQLHD